jgi:hypothetical protein
MPFITATSSHLSAAASVAAFDSDSCLRRQVTHLPSNSACVPVLALTHRCVVVSAGAHAGALSEGGTGPAILTPAAAVACCHLEGGLYSANVVLGRLLDVNTPEVDAMVSQLVAAGAHAATNYTSEYV